MDERISLQLLDKASIAWAQDTVTRHHYLHRPVDSRCSVEGYAVHLENIQAPVGLFLLGRPEATRCGAWYGSVEDVDAGRCEVTRWQVLNLARVWFDPVVQRDGYFYTPEFLPGFFDRFGQFRSTLVSQALKNLMARIGHDYLIKRPPCFLDEPFELRYMLSYCDSNLHKGTIYQSAGFEHFRTNDRGIQTWRISLPGLSVNEDMAVRKASLISPRSNRYRALRAQLQFGI